MDADTDTSADLVEHARTLDSDDARTLDKEHSMSDLYRIDSSSLVRYSSSTYTVGW